MLILTLASVPSSLLALHAASHLDDQVDTPAFGFGLMYQGGQALEKDYWEGL